MFSRNTVHAVRLFQLPFRRFMPDRPADHTDPEGEDPPAEGFTAGENTRAAGGMTKRRTNYRDIGGRYRG